MKPITEGLSTEGLSDVKNLFPNAEEIINTPAIGYAINRGAFETRTPVWAFADDPLELHGYTMCLIKFLDGTPIAVRYFESDIVIEDNNKQG